MKTQIPNDKLSMIDEIHEAINAQMTQLEADYK
jgi:hypothetical protein